MVSQLLIVLMTLLVSGTVLFGQPPADPPAPVPIATSLELAPFKDDATPEETLKQVESLWQTQINAETPLEANQMKIQVLTHIVEGAGLLIEKPEVDAQIAQKAIQNKMEALGILAQAGDPTALVTAMTMAQTIAKDPRPLVAREGKLILLSSRLQELQTLDDAGRKAFVEELMGLLNEAPMTQREAQIASMTAEYLEQLGDDNLPQSIYEALAKAAKNAATPDLRARAEEFEGVARRLGLVGKEMKLSGTSLDGQEVDLKNYKGKVVLIQFWASWCGYCLQEMPSILRMKSTYGEDGFEVIGVNLDDTADRARSMVAEMHLTWPNLFSTDPQSMGMSNPNAVRYGVVSIPQCILVGRDGKVLSLNARGNNLETLLEQQFLNSESANE